jgi:outer membrane protein
MQRIILSVLLALITTIVAQAQTDKGNMSIGGDVSYQNTSYSGGASSTTTSFSPSFGYFISDRLALGLSLGLSNTSTTGSPSSSTTSIAPFIRFYKFTAENKFAFFVHGQVGYSTTTGQNGVTSVAVRPGFAYFFTTRWGLDFLLPGLTLSSGNNTTNFDLTASLNPGIGFRYYFGRK